MAHGGSVTVSSSGNRFGAWLELSTSGGSANLYVGCTIPLMLQHEVSFPNGKLVLVGFVDTAGNNEATAACGIHNTGKSKKSTSANTGKSKKSTSAGKTKNPSSKRKKGKARTTRSKQKSKKAGHHFDSDYVPDMADASDVKYTFGSRWPNCLSIDDAVVIGADLADCGLHGSTYHCDHWNLTDACEGPAAVPGTDEMNAMCSDLCRNVPGCRGFMVDTVTDPNSGLCILGAEGSFGLVRSCFFYASSDRVLSDQDCHPPCAICGDGGPKRRLTQLTFKWRSHDSSGTTVGAVGAVTNGGVVAHGGSVTVSSSGNRFGARLELSTSGGSANLHVGCTIPLVLQQEVSFPDGELVLVSFVDTAGETENDAVCDNLAPHKGKRKFKKKYGASQSSKQTCSRPTHGASVDNTPEHTQLISSAVAAGILGAVVLVILIVAIVGAKRNMAKKRAAEAKATRDMFPIPSQFIDD